MVMWIIRGVGKETSPGQILRNFNTLLVGPTYLNQCATLKETKPEAQYKCSLVQCTKLHSF